METWPEIRGWRRTMRAELLARRLAVPRGERQRIGSVLREQLRTQFPELHRACIGFYWAFKGEIDVRDVIEDFLALGATAALPVVVRKQQPLEFWAWHPRMKLWRGMWDIPVPAEPSPVRPTALLVPLLGFDAAGYRLGYGGGYYDRTLATMNPRPLTIGVGYELGRLATIHPLPHDQPLDAIVTEAETVRFRDGGEPLGRAVEIGRPASTTEHDGDDVACASPPCFMHEIAAEYLGYLSTSETISLLNLLLEGERAGTRAVAKISSQAATGPARATLLDIAADEGRFCAMLARHVARLGGTPSPRTGAFYDKLIALDALDARIDLLNRGQAWVVRELQKALPKIGDDVLRLDLETMLEVHERNILRCGELR